MPNIEMALDTLQTRFARLLAEYTSSQQTLKQRITKIEQQSSREEDAVVETTETNPAVSPTSTRTRVLLDIPSRCVPRPNN